MSTYTCCTYNNVWFKTPFHYTISLASSVHNGAPIESAWKKKSNFTICCNSIAVKFNEDGIYTQAFWCVILCAKGLRM